MDRKTPTIIKSFCINSRLKPLNFNRFVKKSDRELALKLQAQGLVLKPVQIWSKHIGWSIWG